jgi:hypothetical protein
VPYITFIDDSKFLAVSNRSQVVVANADASGDTVCAFWMSPPDACDGLLVDYNSQSYRLVEVGSGQSAGSIFDLATQKKTGEFRSEKTKLSCLQWLTPISRLFLAAGQNLVLYDERMKENQNVATIKGIRDPVAGCNSSLSMPLYLVLGKTTGSVTMFDLRTMTPVMQTSAGTSVRQFQVHKRLPFALGLGEKDSSMYALSFHEQAFRQTEQPFQAPVHSFALHSSEPACAVRSGNCVMSVNIGLRF